MSTWTGSKSFSSNYVPHPVPSYTPMGCHRCERCNRLMKDGRECDCASRDVKPEPREIEIRKCDWHKFRDHTGKGKSNGGSKRSNAAGDAVLVAGGVGADGRRDSGCDLREGWQKALKPCPFCGTRTLAMKKAFNRYKVRCEKCVTVYGPSGYTPDDAMRNWNRRKQ